MKDWPVKNWSMSLTARGCRVRGPQDRNHGERIDSDGGPVRPAPAVSTSGTFTERPMEVRLFPRLADVPTSTQTFLESKGVKLDDDVIILLAYEKTRSGFDSREPSIKHPLGVLQLAPESAHRVTRDAYKAHPLLGNGKAPVPEIQRFRSWKPGAGVGEALLAEAETYARTVLGVHAVGLHAGAENEKLQQYYARQGYFPTTDRTSAFASERSGGERVLPLAKGLGPLARARICFSDASLSQPSASCSLREVESVGMGSFVA